MGALLLVAGCGGKGALGPKAIQKEATGLQSLAAEGGVVAGDASRGRSTSVFVHVHATELAKAARVSATTLATGRTEPARALVAVAKRVGSDLERLAVSGSDRAEQRTLEIDLTRAAERAKTLGS